MMSKVKLLIFYIEFISLLFTLYLLYFRFSFTTTDTVIGFELFLVGTSHSQQYYSSDLFRRISYTSIRHYLSFVTKKKYILENTRLE